MNSVEFLLQQPLLRPLRRLAKRWQARLKSACDPYRPELHYMRGPGPKWHARQQAALHD